MELMCGNLVYGKGSVLLTCYIDVFQHTPEHGRTT